MSLFLRLAAAIMFVSLENSVVWSRKTPKHVTSLPKSCSRDFNVVTCRCRAHFRFDKLATNLTFESGVDFVVMSPGVNKCSCKMLSLTRRLSQSQILVVSTTHCGMEQLRKCGSRLSLARPVQLAGLLVSRDETSLRWVAGHQAMATWHRVQTAHSNVTRAAVYRGIIQEIRDAENSLFSKEMDTYALDPLHKYRHPTKKIKDAKKPKYKSSEDLEYRQTLVAKKSDKRLTYKANEERRAKEILTRKRLNQLDPPTEQELVQTLDAELSDLRSVRNLTHSFVKRAGAKMSRVIRGKTSNVSASSSDRRWRRLSRSRREPNREVSDGRKKSKKRKQKHLYVVPYCLYAGGDFHDLYDDLKVSRALEQDRAVARMKQSIKESSMMTSQHDPLQLMDLALVDLPPGMADLIAAHHGLSQQSADKIKAVKMSEPIVAVADGPILLVDVTTRKDRKTILPGDKTSGYISERDRYDHRVKSFIIFFIAIFGILVVMASLLILAMKEKNTPNSLEPYPRVRRSKILLQQNLEQQRREDEARDVIQDYPGVEADKFTWPRYIAANVPQPSPPRTGQPAVKTPELSRSLSVLNEGVVSSLGLLSPRAASSKSSVKFPGSPKPSLPAVHDYLGGKQVVLDLGS